MTMDITFGEIMVLNQMFANDWEKIKAEISLSPKSTYNLVAIKRKLQECASTFQETVVQIAQKYGGAIQQDGSLRVPDDKIEDVNKELIPAQGEAIALEITPIEVSSEDKIPVELMDALFDFIEMK